MLGGSEMLNQDEWLGGGCEDARDKVRKNDVGKRWWFVGQAEKKS
jgi:hypothetical protein